MADNGNELKSKYPLLLAIKETYPLFRLSARALTEEGCLDHFEFEHRSRDEDSIREPTNGDVQYIVGRKLLRLGFEPEVADDLCTGDTYIERTYFRDGQAYVLSLKELGNSTLVRLSRKDRIVDASSYN